MRSIYQNKEKADFLNCFQVGIVGGKKYFFLNVLIGFHSKFVPVSETALRFPVRSLVSEISMVKGKMILFRLKWDISAKNGRRKDVKKGN